MNPDIGAPFPEMRYVGLLAVPLLVRRHAGLVRDHVADIGDVVNCLRP